jgi:radical SAM superfamily enzyme with C-terminal helix-hairpin-helix motif
MSRTWLVSALVLLVVVFGAGPATAQFRSALINRKPSGNIVNPRVDLNTASQADLVTLPGIDEAVAKAVIDGRPYKSADELVSRKIVSAEAYELIRPRVSVGEK